MPLHVLDHPLASHLVAGLRDKETAPDRFRLLCRTLTTLLVIEATRALRTRDCVIETPLKATDQKVLSQGIALVPILRAGLGMLESAVELFPDVAVGYIGLERHEDTAIARSYYTKLPSLTGRYTLCLDPMLATGGSASQALSLVKQRGASPAVMVCVVAAPEGVATVEANHPDVHVYTAALDEGLDARKYIVPGLGDFGDRLYGTP